jgi:hypothetical protein
MTLPTIIPNDHPVWKFRVGVYWRMWLPATSLPDWTLGGWASCHADTFTVHKDYAFDGVSSPIFRKKLEAIPSVLAAALLHDVILQAKRECPEAGITWADTVQVWKAALRAFHAPFPRILGAAVAVWFNPIFNLLRK